MTRVSFGLVIRFIDGVLGLVQKVVEWRDGRKKKAEPFRLERKARSEAKTVVLRPRGAEKAEE